MPCSGCQQHWPKPVERRARWVNDGVQTPALNAEGLAFPCAGTYDRSSVEYGAWFFQPDGVDDGAYYCDPERDLEFLEG